MSTRESSPRRPWLSRTVPTPAPGWAAWTKPRECFQTLRPPRLKGPHTLLPSLRACWLKTRVLLRISAHLLLPPLGSWILFCNNQARNKARLTHSQLCPTEAAGRVGSREESQKSQKEATGRGLLWRCRCWGEGAEKMRKQPPYVQPRECCLSILIGLPPPLSRSTQGSGLPTR